jgi:hypothetical protein
MSSFLFFLAIFFFTPRWVFTANKLLRIPGGGGRRERKRERETERERERERASAWTGRI